MTVANQLNTLETAGLIRLAQAQPEVAYLFRHALVQDAAYATLVKVDRHELHGAVAGALEALYVDRLESRELAPVLAHHLYEAGEFARALHYFKVAGEAATQSYANAEAVMHYGRALTLLPDLAPPPDSELVIQLYAGRGRALELNGRFEAALDNYHELESLARARGDRTMEVEALLRQATVYALPTAAALDRERSFVLGQRALELSRALGDRQAEMRSLWNLSLSSKFSGRVDDTVRYGEAAIAIGRAENLRQILASALNDVAPAYLAQGRRDESLALVDEALGLWRALGNIPLLADCLTNAAGINFMLGRPEAFEQAREAYALSKSIGNLWGISYSGWAYGGLLAQRGESSQAIRILEESVRLGAEAEFAVVQVTSRSLLARLYADLGDLEQAFALARKAAAVDSAWISQYYVLGHSTLAWLHLQQGEVEVASRQIEKLIAAPDIHEPYAASTIYLAEIDVALARQDYARALQLAEALLARLAQLGVRMVLPDALWAKAQALLGLMRFQAAREVLWLASTEAEVVTYRRLLWLIFQALSRLEAKQGNRDLAAAYGRRAAEIVRFMAEHLDSEPQRARFLAQPNVQEVLRSA